MLSTMSVKSENMRSAAAGGFINATDCADYLVKKGLPFREAYTIVGRLVSQCITNDKTLENLSIDEYKAVSPVFDTDVYDYISLETCLANRKVPGGPAPESVLIQINSAKDFIKERKIK